MSQSNTYILIHHLHYTVNDKPLFTDLSFALGNEKTGLIGRNGVGKSSLLKIIMGEISPQAGTLQINKPLGYCPQQIQMTPDQTVADFLAIRDRLDALFRIQAGSIDEQDFQLVADDWLIEERTGQQLAEVGLAHLPFNQAIQNLSGGEKTRLQLAKVFLANPNFIILDEPTNNLDQEARQFLYTLIARWNKGLLIVSHDRSLLNLMDQIVELTSLGVNVYGGNYDDYHEQKSVQQEAAQQSLLDAKKTLSTVKQSTQSSREIREKKQSRGRKQFLTGKVDKLTARSRQGRSEKTQKRLVTQADSLIKNATQQLETAKNKIEMTREIHIDLAKTNVPNGKIILDIENLSFAYEDKPFLIQHFNLQIRGPERIAIMGNNGSGKTTLLKLILNKLTPQQGKILLGTERICYLDQNANSLNGELSVLDNFMQLNADAKITEAHHALAQFLFRNTTALKQVKHLSGGEKLRAELACKLMSTQPPQLLILDEPTNHLDLESIESIESALNHYQGALIIISHDEQFIHNIHIDRFINPFFV